MPKFRFMLCVVAAVAASLIYTSPTHAASDFVYVASTGVDTNPCTQTAPCRSMQRALSQVVTGGVVTVLDSLTLDSFVVRRSVTIVAAHDAQVIVSETGRRSAAIIIQATDVVTLRGLTLMGHGTGKYGIWYKDDAKLRVENCIITGFKAVESAAIHGLSGGELIVTDTIVRDNDGGIVVNVRGGKGATALIDRCRVEHDKGIAGIYAGPQSRVTVANSTVTSSVFGFFAQGTMVITNCVAENNNWGIINGSTGTIVVGGSTITLNGHGIKVDGSNQSHIYSMGNNLVFKNSINVEGPLEHFSGT